MYNKNYNNNFYNNDDSDDEKSGIAARIRKLGKLIISYSLFKALGPICDIVLARLITEFYHARKYNYLDENNSFCYDVKELNFHLGIPEDEIVNALNKLKELNLIKLESHGNINFVTLNEEDIVDFEYVAEERNHYKSWKYKLDELQKNIKLKQNTKATELDTLFDEKPKQSKW